MPTDTFDNGAGINGLFTFKNVFFPNSYDAEFDFWSGWAMSTMTDTTTPGFGNQYSCISGEGAMGSSTYLVTYAPDDGHIYFSGRTVVQGLFVNNSTYTYLSMRDGDAFAKQFGGPNGTDPDFLKVTFRGYLDGRLTQDSVAFFLADFRGTSEQDYIIRDWTYIDLTTLGEIDSLHYTMSSSDVGSFGINTPTYFCIDRMIVDRSVTNTADRSVSEWKLFPNPATSLVNIPRMSDSWDLITLVDSQGNVLLTTKPSEQLNIEFLHPGMYWVNFLKGGAIDTKMIIKQ